jgi:hypothetical protein
MQVIDPNGYRGSIEYVCAGGEFVIVEWEDGTASCHLSAIAGEWVTN